MMMIFFYIYIFFLFLASLAMYTVEMDRNLLSTVATLIVTTSIIEIILVMIVCQFSRLVKRGDAARQEIQSIHSYHRECRHSRSRSQSHIRSIHGNDFNLNDDQLYGVNYRLTQSPIPLSRPLSLSLSSSPSSQSMMPNSTSHNVSIEPSSSFIITDTNNNNDESIMADNDYLPPPIYLKLDR